MLTLAFASTPSRHRLPVLCECFADVIEEVLSKCLAKIADERCGHIRDAIYTLTMHPFGKIERKNPVYFKVGGSELELATMAALLDYERELQRQPLAAFRNVDL